MASLQVCRFTRDAFHPPSVTLMDDEIRDEPILSPKEPVLPDQPTLLNELAQALDVPVLPDAPVCSADVWYDDGTLVLCAENTLFRVYRGILAAQSEIFRDMLSVPQPPGTDGDMFEGCPLVHVQETVDDMTRFLRALLEPRCVRSPLLRQTLIDVPGTSLENAATASPTSCQRFAWRQNTTRRSYVSA
jgi:hypothetical protein